MVDVMSALLAPTQAWTVFDQEKKTVDRESLGLVGPALITLGLDPAFVDNVWQKEILNKYIELAESQISKVADAVHHHIKTCLDGNFGSLDNAQADKVLLLLPGKTPLKQHLSLPILQSRERSGAALDTRIVVECNQNRKQPELTGAVEAE